MTCSCKGVCWRFKAVKLGNLKYHDNGFRCPTCEIFINLMGIDLTKTGGRKLCKCCHTLVRLIPRKTTRVARIKKELKKLEEIKNR